MKTFFKILLLAAVFTSCDDVEPTIFHGDDPAEQTFITFSSGTYSLPIERDGTGVNTITLNVSTVSTVDRVYNLEVVQGTANPATFSVPASVTIPAMQYQATFEITGQDNGLVDDVIKSFVLKISEDSLGDESTGFVESTINVYEVCPLESPFLGQYNVDGITSVFGGNNPALYPFGHNATVELVEGDSQYERVFNTILYPGYGSSPSKVVIIFQCDYLNLGAKAVSTVGCGTVVDENGDVITIELSPADRELRAAYNTFNDASFSLSFRENTSGACNAGALPCTATFTKL